MIKSIRLINWKTHEDTVLDFQAGTNIIVGLMGAGKSSMLDAISFALFGTFPAIEHRRYKVEDIIMNRPSQKSNATVELELSLNKDLYKISRTISRNKKNSAKIEKNGEYLQTQSERVNEEIESILKINYDVFSRAIYAEQNRLDYFLELRKGERKKQIDEMLGLDRFSMAEENATSLVNALKSRISENEKFLLSSDIGSMLSKMKELQKNYEEEQKKYSELYKSSADLKDLVASIRLRYQEAKALNDKRIAISKSIAETESRISTLKAQLNKIKLPGKSIEELDSESQSIEKQSSELDSKLESLESKEKDSIRNISKLSTELERCMEDIKKREEIKAKIGTQTPEDLKSKINALQTDIKSYVSAVADAKSMLKETQKWLTELNSHGGKCPICEKPLEEDLKAHLSMERSSRIKDLEVGIKEKELAMEKAEAELNSLRRKYDEINILSKNLLQYSDSDSKAEKLKSDISSAKSNNEGLMKEIASLKPQKDALSKAMEKIRSDSDAAKRAESIKSEITSSEKELGFKRDQISQMKITDKEIEDIRESFTIKNSEYTKVVTEASALKESYSRLKLQIDELSKSISQSKAIEEKISSMRRHSVQLSRFKSALVDTESQLRERLVAAINELLEGLWIGLYPYGDYSTIALRAYPDDYSLDASVIVEGKETWFPVDGIASGGERSIACLALRIAMSMVIVPNLKWLILDEPTHNLDSQGITKMIEVFSNSLPSIVEQIFVITHDDAIKQVHNARIYEFNRDKENNGFTTVTTG